LEPLRARGVRKRRVKIASRTRLSTTTPAGLPDSLREASEALNRIGVNPAIEAWRLLQGVQPTGAGIEPVASLKKAAGSEGDAVERLLLWHAARQAATRIPGVPVEDSVRTQLDQDLSQLHASTPTLAAPSYEFARAAQFATLRRFPAGPMEWEVGGIPRSFLLKARLPGALRLWSFVTFRLGGWAPYFVMHVAPKPRQRGLTMPKLVMRGYYRMARSLQLQPAVRGLLGLAWFHDPAALRDYPHLQPLNEPYTEYGGLIVLLDLAPPSSGVLVGNAQRAANYQSGKLVYRIGLALWPRSAAVRWADEHPEYGD
jgi:hypothetical protein